MSAAIAPLRSRICRVRVRPSGPGDATRMAHAIEQALSVDELEPPAWPPGSLLFVKSLSFRLRGSSPPGARALERSLREQVSVAARSAVRPSRGRLPAGAPVVLFVDLAEALAVLALSALERRAAGEWWWHRLWPHADLADWVSLWRRHPHAVPSAVAAMDTHRTLERVAASLPDTTGLALLAAVAESFDLGHWMAGVERAQVIRSKGAPPARSTDARVEEGESSAPRVSLAAAERELSRWSGVACDRRLSPFVRLWIAASLGVVREPRRVRDARFAEVAVRIAQPLDLLERRATSEAPHQPADSPAADGSSGGDRQHEARDVVASPGAGQTRNVAGASPSRSSEASNDRTCREPENQPRSSEALLATEHREPESATPGELEESSQPDELVNTSFAGVFYLANVALSLELYADFTGPARPGLALPFWDFLAASAERLLSPDERGLFRKDPLSAWLRAIAGRAEMERPGAGVASPAVWCVPESWRTWASSKAPPVGPRSITSWDGWFCELMPWLEHRLELALGPAPDRVLRQVGSVVRFRQRIDVHFALALHPIAVRLAGLDRDPGWIPAAGADLRFHYD